jgi:predicted Zn-dependent peptidase
LVTDEEMDANANLIVDAFKVRQAINCELSELLQQRNEMLAMLELLVKNCNDSNRNDTIEDAEELIKKVKGNG